MGLGATLHALQLLPCPQDLARPAMEAGVTDHVWVLQEIMSLLDADAKLAA